jgi:hypothetical protein
MCTYNATADAINPFQVVIMYENHIAVGCALDRLRKDGGIICSVRGTYLGDMVEE